MFFRNIFVQVILINYLRIKVKIDIKQRENYKNINVSNDYYGYYYIIKLNSYDLADYIEELHECHVRNPHVYRDVWKVFLNNA